MNVQAVAGEDFIGLDNLIISFEPEETSVTETIQIINDQKMEGDEVFQIGLHEIPNVPNNLGICSDNATVLIRDDDGMFNNVLGILLLLLLLLLLKVLGVA